MMLTKLSVDKTADNQLQKLNHDCNWLLSVLVLAIGACVLLRRNIDTKLGLVNGYCNWWHLVQQRELWIFYPSTALPIVAQRLLQDVTEGLKHIHELRHLFKDLKEDNIDLYRAGSERVIIDFGKCMLETSCSLNRLSESKHKTYKRRHWHVSPELVSGMSKPSTASDIYSLGRVIKHNRPFHCRVRSMAYTSAEKYVPFRVSA